MANGTGQIDAVVLAGGINSLPLFDGDTGGYRALLPFHGKPSVRYTLEALHAVPQVSRIAIVGDARALTPVIGSTYPILPGGETLWDSLAAGLRHFAEARTVLITTADTPLITPAAIADFLTACAGAHSEYDYNLHLAMVPAGQFTGPFANCPKYFNRFRDGSFCHGNLLLADPQILTHPAASRRINALYGARKNAVKAALTVGLRVGLGYVLGVHLWHLLTLQHMARLASARFHVGLVPVLINRPEIAIDIDEPADYECVRQLLMSNEAAGG